MTGNNFAVGSCYVLVKAKSPHKAASYLRP